MIHENRVEIHHGSKFKVSIRYHILDQILSVAESILQHIFSNLQQYDGLSPLQCYNVIDPISALVHESGYPLITSVDFTK